nr:NosD domain-containing protein [Candidatus Sigynarchaeota archaeon]
MVAPENAAARPAGIHLADTIPPVIINGNAELAVFIGSRGSGQGTLPNPYVLQNISISAGHVGSCLLLNGTDKYLVIRNCTFIASGSNAGTVYDAGIQLFNCSHVTITDCSVHNNSVGIVMIQQSSNNTVSGNHVTNNSFCGILIRDMSEDNVVESNTIIENNQGIMIYYSYENHIQRNDVTNNIAGIFIHESHNNAITANNFSRNGDTGGTGIILHIAENNTIVGNDASHNINYGILCDTLGPGNLIYLNRFAGNGISEALIMTLGRKIVSFQITLNEWDNGTHGNYWGNYSTRYPNATNNGITWNMSYIIPVMGTSFNDADQHPLAIWPYPAAGVVVPGYDLGWLFAFGTIAVVMIVLKMRVKHTRIK